MHMELDRRTGIQEAIIYIFFLIMSILTQGRAYLLSVHKDNYCNSRIEYTWARLFQL